MKQAVITIIILGFVVAIAFVGMRFKPTMPSLPGDLKTTSVTYACNDRKSIKATFIETTGTTSVQTAKVMLSDGRTMTLSHTRAADGVRYANPDESFVFWSKGNGALVLENSESKSYIGCIAVAPEPIGQNLGEVYVNNGVGFSIRLPGVVGSTTPGYLNSFKVDETYKYILNPTISISGVKFVLPEVWATSTNLGSDSYISVEGIPQTPLCSANLFLDGTHDAVEVNEPNHALYSVASSTGAGAGNRYEETIYAFPGTNPCIAIRYFIHYGVIGNYPPNTVKEFNKEGIKKQLDAIRHTLIINQ